MTKSKNTKKSKQYPLGTLTIDRKKWLTGEVIHHVEETTPQCQDSGLLEKVNGHGEMMCCLGFEAVRCGVPKRACREEEYPSCVADRFAHHREALKHMTHAGQFGYNDVEAVLLLATTNDDRDLSRDARERDVTKGFAMIGVRVKFVGQYPKWLE